ncbi:hypothetical protein SAMN05216174_102217 [Actinokineospora iranica]|uniref:Uncharacterized protein n=1 Tax=Actinokineospora iranica TaxID=1271860 RepID=A0A1G6LSE5_9PSEU|nr:hypothetical protein SAMN05216174_102217 [Actinokineospora iranica]
MLTACAGHETPNSQNPAAQPPPTAAGQAPEGQPARTPPGDHKPVPPGQIDATALPEGYPKKVWTEGDGKTVGVVAQEGGCGKASAEVAEQTPRRIVLLLVETTPSTPEMCTMDLRYPTVTVELEQPLGERTVVLKSEQRTS